MDVWTEHSLPSGFCYEVYLSRTLYSCLCLLDITCLPILSSMFPSHLVFFPSHPSLLDSRLSYPILSSPYQSKAKQSKVAPNSPVTNCASKFLQTNDLLLVLASLCFETLMSAASDGKHRSTNPLLRTESIGLR